MVAIATDQADQKTTEQDTRTGLHSDVLPDLSQATFSRSDRTKLDTSNSELTTSRLPGLDRAAHYSFSHTQPHSAPNAIQTPQTTPQVKGKDPSLELLERQQQLEQERKAQERILAIQKEVQQLAERNANNTFKEKNFDKQLERDLQAISTKYNMTKNEVAVAGKEYVDRYSDRANTLYDEMSWYKRAYYSTKEFISSNYDRAKNIVDAVAKQALPEAVYKVAKEVAVTGEKYIKAGVQIAEEAIEHLPEAAKAVGGFVKGVADDLGVTDVFNGRIIIGAAKFVGEITGITDGIKCIKALANGDYASAAVHGGFAVVGLVGTGMAVFTGGASMIAANGVRIAGKSLIKEGLEVAVKEGFEVMAKDLGKEVAQSLTKETLEKAGKIAGQETIQQIDKEIAAKITREGASAVTEKFIKETSSTAAEKAVAGQVKSVVTELVEDVVYKWGRNAIDNPAKFMEAAKKSGIADDVAKKMQKTLAKGKSDIEIKGILKKEMADPIEARLRNGMKETFDREVREGATRLRAKHALSEASEKAIKEGCEEGFELGLKKGLKEALENGIESAFKRLRSRPHRGLNLQGGEGIELNVAGDDLLSRRSQGASVGASSGDEATKFAKTGDRVDIRSGLGSSETGLENNGIPSDTLQDGGRSTILKSWDDPYS